MVEGGKRVHEGEGKKGVRAYTFAPLRAVLYSSFLLIDGWPHSRLNAREECTHEPSRPLCHRTGIPGLVSRLHYHA